MGCQKLAPFNYQSVMALLSQIKASFRLNITGTSRLNQLTASFAVLLLLISLPKLTLGKPLVRVNLIGYLNGDSKIAVVASSVPLTGQAFLIVEHGRIVYRGYLSADRGIYQAHAHNYLADFSALKGDGLYRLVLDSTESDDFEIGRDVYHSLPDSLLRFFAVQRCGKNTPLLHSPCHLSDVSKVVNGDTSMSPVDLTGGWHDAGDYLKFSITTAYSSYLLLLTYQEFPSLFNKWLSFKQAAPVVEAKIGLEWLIKTHLDSSRLISQVQNLNDHGVGWRLPENDPLATKRTGYAYGSKATAGSTAAALALGSVVFKKLGDEEFGRKCLTHAIDIFDMAMAGRLPERDARPDSHYFDSDSRDNIALAAVELYRATKVERYLTIAKQLSDTLGAGGWISWGDLQGIVAFRLAEYHPIARDYLEWALISYQEASLRNPYAYPFQNYPWGSLSLQTGVGILVAGYELAGGSDQFRALATRQRDAIFGVNPFGISYLANVGDRSTRFFHHQVSHLKNVTLPGGLAEGAIARKEFDDSGIRLERADSLIHFQSDLGVYHDDRMDFLTNEPTIGNNAQAIFLLGWFANMGR